MTQILPKAKLATQIEAGNLQNLTKLKGQAGAHKTVIPTEKKQEFAKAARGFESMFMNMMYKEMKKNVKFGEDGGGDGGFGADTLEGFTDMAFTDQLSNNGSGIGIAESIFKQLTGESLNDLKPKSKMQKEAIEKIGAKINQIMPNANSNYNKATPIGDSFIERLSDRIGNYKDMISSASSKYGVPTSLINAVIGAESAGKNEAVSKAGAKGLMQLMDGTAKDLGVSNSFDPKQNIEAGTKYLSQLLNKYDGNIDLTLAAYNSGPGNVDKYNGIPPFNETQSYIKRVKRYEQLLQADLTSQF
jgi:Rod binding domain-containing protein